jgi:hypothetical protein
VLKGALMMGICAAALAANPVAAQEADPPAEPAAEAAEAEASVTSFPVSFFAEYRPTTAMEMINRMPGFSFDRGSNARGFSGTAGNVLIDGERPPSRSDSLDAILSRIPASSVLRIDLIRGGAGGIDMQGRTVVANVIRKPSTGLQGAVSSNLNVDTASSVFTTSQLQLQRRKDQRSIEGSITFSAADPNNTSDRIRLDPNGALLLRSHREMDGHFRDTSITGVYEDVLFGGSLRVNTRYAWEQNSDNTLDAHVADFTGSGDEILSFRGHERHGELGVRYSHKLGPEASFELVAFQQLNDEGYLNRYDTVGLQTTTSDFNRRGETIVSGKLKSPTWGNWTFETGVEEVFNFADGTTDYTLNGAALSLEGDSSRVEELRSEAFVTSTWTPTPKLNVESAVRYELSTITAVVSDTEAEKTLGFLKPRMTVTWSPSTHHQFLLRAERTVDQLQFGAFRASASFNTGILGVGNADIEPSKTWTYEARYEYRFGQKGSILLHYTREQLTDVLGRVVVLVPQPGGADQVLEITRNVAQASRNVFAMNANVPLDNVGLAGGLLTVRSSVRTSDTLDPVTFERRALSNIRPYEHSINLSQNITRLRLTWNVGAFVEGLGRSYGPRTLSDFRSDYRLGAGLTYRPNDKLSLGAGVNTLTGGESINHFVLFSAPRPGGLPSYFEEARSPNRTQVYVSLRRSI